MAIEPRHISDEELRERLRAGMGGMPSMPRGGMPGMPAAGAAPRIMAPPTAEPVAPPTAPAATPALPAAQEPAQRPSRLPVSPEVAEYAKRMSGDRASQGQSQGKLPSQGWGAMVHGIMMAQLGKEPDYRHFEAMDKQALEQRQQAKADAEKQQAKALAAENADPNSARSQAAKKRMSPLLAQLGMTPEEIATLSGDDISKMAQGGDLVTTVAGARAKAKAAQEAQAAETAKAQEERGYKEKESDRTSARDYTEQMEIAKVQALIAEGRNAEAMALSDQYAQLREERAEQRRREEAGTAADTRTKEKHEMRLRDYGKELTGHNIPDTSAQVARLRSNIETAKAKNGGAIFSRRDELIRRGPQTGWGLMSKEGQRVMSDLQSLKNTKIKNTSGQAVTVSEMPRVEAGMGTGFFTGDAEIDAFVNNVDAELDTVRTAIGAGYDPEVVSTYQGNIDALREKPDGEKKAPPNPAAAPKPSAGEQPTPGWVAPAPPGKVNMVNPQTGEVKPVPEANAAKAEERGWRRQ